MPTTIKSKLKSWMVVYVGFVLALTAANFDISPKTAAELVSPGSLPGLDSMEQTYFRPAVTELPRNDI